MRILDKNKDFYDYLQYMYVDDTVTFDRTDSFIITKEDMCNHLWVHKHMDVGNCQFVLLQVCHTFWLFYVEITKIEKHESWYTRFSITDYDVSLVKCWKNYDLPRKLIRLNLINFGWRVGFSIWDLPMKERRNVDYKAQVIKHADYVDAVNHNNYDIEKSIDEDTVRLGSGEIVTKHIPIIKQTGLSTYIDDEEIYHSLEEYFSLQKQDSERTESIGITDKEKIENHGYDVKISFRGK